MDEETVIPDDTNQECRATKNVHKCGNIGDSPILQEDGMQNVEPVNDPDAVNRKEKEREREVEDSR